MNKTNINHTFKEVDGQKYEVGYYDGGKVGFQPKGKNNKKKLLWSYVLRVATDRWRNIPKSRATLEKTLIKELIENI